ncbi:M1 family metallopeptidase [Mesoflavibacter sp. SCSIO 43206]|uniref:M1 family metallopeptidase n=1 Tax=Mesoflavibacter sp. SCSIO 43206 TaxID=2779362 RepID=UPI001CA99AD9|nr:M1 family metallopeptidase [Mesoflavibacter sp. SCSIO 43206]UAB74835.1 M1 family metallopeptidase [Mesoflavibacter sp. SCSIO 43206]
MRYYLLLLFTFFSCLVTAQQTDVVDFKRIKANIMHRGYENVVTGRIFIDFQIKKKTDTIFLDAINTRVRDWHLYSEDSKEPDYRAKIFNSDNKIFIIHNFKKNKKYKLHLDYGMTPKKALYFTEKENSNQIWTQGQGKYTSNWLPSIDDMNDKIEFDLNITYDKDYTVIANGKLTEKQNNESTITWHYDMQQPMSSYLVALVIGKYNKKEINSKSGIPIHLYYYLEDSAKVEPTYRYTKQMFDFLEDEIGVAYPWQNYKQVPVKDFLYSGMENTSCTIFSDDFMIDEVGFVDKNYVNVNAHELAHHWFGDLVTETSGIHHWLQEGFATYYALLAERDIFGDDYYYWQLYQYLKELAAQEQAEQSTALLDPKSSSTTFYKKGAWVLHVLREKVGDKAFKTAVKHYLNKYAYGNVETNDFISEVEKASKMDLSNFVQVWLKNKALPINEMTNALQSNETSAFLLTIEEHPYLTTYRTDDDDNYIPSSLVTQLPDGFYPIQVSVLKEALSKPDYPTYNDLAKEAFASKNLHLRQALALNMADIPEDFQQDYETLLKDQSYVTIEAALYNLWANFPRKRNEYLEQTQSVFGFNDYNVRTLWLTLALATPEFQTDKKQDFFEELVSYTSPKLPFSLRQNAFGYLSSIGVFNEDALKHLIEASKHHNWRFKSFAKSLLEKLSEDDRYQSIISNLQK